VSLKIKTKIQQQCIVYQHITGQVEGIITIQKTFS